MNILFDIGHPAQLNFLKTIIDTLKIKGYNIHLATLNRGKIPDIIKKELPEFPLYIYGRKGKNQLDTLINNAFIRLIQLFRLVRKNKYVLLTGTAIVQLAFIGKILKIPTIGLNDDPEFKSVMKFLRIFLDVLYVPKSTNITGNNIIQFNGLKEWSYLSPKYFSPDKNILKQYNLEEKEYYFIRYVDNRTMNYQYINDDLIEKIINDLLKDRKIILSLEDKSKATRFPNCIILKEPVKDIHSLIYYSKMVISNGDSIPREGALLGVESLYCGNRDMAVNRFLNDKKLLYINSEFHEIAKIINQIDSNFNKTLSQKIQLDIRNNLLKEFDDLNIDFVNMIETKIKEKQ